MTDPRKAALEAPADSPPEGPPEGPPQGPLEDTADDEERIRLTPGLVILGLLAVALGLLSAVVMSAHSLAR